MLLIQQIKLIHVEVKDSWSLSFKTIALKILLIEIIFEDDKNLVVFSIIKFKSNRIVIDSLS